MIFSKERRVINEIWGYLEGKAHSKMPGPAACLSRHFIYGYCRQMSIKDLVNNVGLNSSGNCAEHISHHANQA
ncbi:MAG: hypothetical protein LC437_02120 [Thiohalomonas sp.]|nr:hypothetical protein [Thiohalomonas sp.]